ncbi:hypothetical protein EJ05DRAFT_473519 [Pseudovirgaria hyperparasitica]|uniref:Core domain-containing protein n=1 Tax=Pseudovirgaria hyperparasitica TaxID=470096 RepID=A0A6A6WFV7_9PEZI|nr:uncharacterized protein EJ05DRAFT_473519 [Pseudovirgaria hyperparasitica]KAF2760944.1 hypothetical protein EJ05DRAFT_473519 [Pseudovirgaria hyperparasitica]
MSNFNLAVRTSRRLSRTFCVSPLEKSVAYKTRASQRIAYNPYNPYFEAHPPSVLTAPASVQKRTYTTPSRRASIASISSISSISGQNASSTSSTRRPHLRHLSAAARRLEAVSERKADSTMSPPSAIPRLHPARPISGPGLNTSASITITPRAADRLAAIAAKDGNPNSALRITIESGGCHGFQYLMDLTTIGAKGKSSVDVGDEEYDTVFEGPKGAKVVMDEASLGLLSGSTVDYTMELIGSQFKVTGIPGASSSCGCGTSFDIKE